MTIPKEAIEKAIEGGWTDQDYDYYAGCADTVLDPLFWQALGKSLGWPEDWRMSRHEYNDNVAGDLWRIGCPGYYAHKFYDLILANGDTAAFWKEILK